MNELCIETGKAIKIQKRAGVGTATDSRQHLDSRVHGDCIHHGLYSTPHPGRTYSRVRHTRTLEYILP